MNVLKRGTFQTVSGYATNIDLRALRAYGLYLKISGQTAADRAQAQFIDDFSNYTPLIDCQLAGADGFYDNYIYTPIIASTLQITGGETPPSYFDYLLTDAPPPKPSGHWTFLNTSQTVLDTESWIYSAATKARATSMSLLIKAVGGGTVTIQHGLEGQTLYYNQLIFTSAIGTTTEALVTVPLIHPNFNLVLTSTETGTQTIFDVHATMDVGE